MGAASMVGGTSIQAFELRHERHRRRHRSHCGAFLLLLALTILSV